MKKFGSKYSPLFLSHQDDFVLDYDQWSLALMTLMMRMMSLGESGKLGLLLSVSGRLYLDHWRCVSGVGDIPRDCTSFFRLLLRSDRQVCRLRQPASGFSVLPITEKGRFEVTRYLSWLDLSFYLNFLLNLIRCLLTVHESPFLIPKHSFPKYIFCVV